METLRTAACVTMSERAVSNSAASCSAVVVVESVFMLSDRRLYDGLSAKIGIKRVWRRVVISMAWDSKAARRSFSRRNCLMAL